MDQKPFDLATWRRWIDQGDTLRLSHRRRKMYRLRELATHPRAEVVAALLWMADTEVPARRADTAHIAAFLRLHELAPQLADWCDREPDTGVVSASIAALWHVGDRRHARAVRAAAERFDHPVISDYGLRVSRALAQRPQPK